MKIKTRKKKLEPFGNKYFVSEQCDKSENDTQIV